jgi:hypothetical protein
MSKFRTNPTAFNDAPRPSIDTDRSADRPLPDAFTQIRDARDRIIAAVIARAEQEGSYQHAKWLFEFGGVLPSGQNAPDDDPSLLRLFLEQLQIPETPEELAAEFSANSHAVE